MLKIKKSHIKNEWIVYNPDNFELHTHVKHKRIAVQIKYLVEHHKMPKSSDKRFIHSVMRVTRNRRYMNELQEYLDSL